LTSAYPNQNIYGDVTAGLIFLGTPHIVSSTSEGWINLKLIMRANRKDISKDNMNDAELETIAFVCKHFEDLSLNAAILSVCEGKETTIRDGIFSSFRSTSKNAITVCDLCASGTNYDC
jgi:hypothetical protein